MSQKLAISETGLKLIKAFEGYRPVDRELVTGQRVVGYGHRLYSEDAVMMSKNDAEEVLRSDLEPFEDMINTKVHAPISQSQFDALCSFAFNIGPKAFLQSDTLRALNNGRHLDAANGLDVWRKSEIAGKTYVVDALMRRRTAEKALFLRTERDLAAGREDLPPVKDTTIESLSTEDAYPVFTEEDASRMVASAPYSARISPARRREDGPAGVLQLSELDILDDEELPDLEEAAELDEPLDLLELDESLIIEEQVIPSDLLSELDVDLPSDETAVLESVEDIDTAVEDTEARRSPIAAAASDIVARLDALIDDADAGFEDRDKDWPDTLVDTVEVDEDAIENSAEADLKGQVIDLNSKALRSEPEEHVSASAGSKKTPTLVIDELAADDAMRPRTDSAAKYIETYSPKVEASEPKKEKHLDSWILLSLGFILLGVAGGTMIRGSQVLLGEWGPIIAVTGFVIGLCLIITGVYAYLRNLRRLKHNLR